MNSGEIELNITESELDSNNNDDDDGNGDSKTVDFPYSLMIPNLDTSQNKEAKTIPEKLNIKFLFILNCEFFDNVAYLFLKRRIK